MDELDKVESIMQNNFNENMKYNAGNMTSAGWDEILNSFDDANIYQTDAFVRSSIGGGNSEKFVLYKNKIPAAAAQVRIKTLPIIKRGIAYIRWGPFWSVKNSEKDPEILAAALKYLIEEYAEKRKLLLRIMPSSLPNNDPSIFTIYTQLGFYKYDNTYKTIILDLTKEKDDLRAGFRKKWRYSLKQAEKNNFELEVGHTDEHFDNFQSIYSDMHSRKKFKETIDIGTFKGINRELPDNKKMKIFLCTHKGKPISASVISIIGSRAIYLLGGSNKEGLKYSASYFLQWKVIEWLKEHGFEFYDLGGIDKLKNPGVYTFKSGMGGEEISFPGIFEYCENKISRLSVKLAELIN